MSARRRTQARGRESDVGSQASDLRPSGSEGRLGNSVLTNVEFATTVVLCVVIGYLHLVILRNAGGMWRDEINSIGCAQAESLKEFLHLQGVVSTHPPPYFVLLRLWTALVGGNDTALRMLAFLVGISLPVALWFNASLLGPAQVRKAEASGPGTMFNRSFPLISLALFGLNADVLWHGDMIRGYGFAYVFLVMTVGFVWRWVVSPSRLVAVLAALSSVGMVQCMYQNVFYVLAICLAGSAVAARHRLWKRAVFVLAVCGVAALSLVPFIPLAMKTRETHLMDQGFVLQDAITVWMRTLNSSGWIAAAAWGTLFLLTVSIAVAAQFSTILGGSPEKRDLALYIAVALPLALIGFCIFYGIQKFGIAPRYYAVLLAFVGVFIQAMVSLLPATRWSRALVVCLSVVVAATSLPKAWAQCHIRHTNVDLIAHRLSTSAAQKDLVVVMPCMYGATFNRYYHGTAAWITLPEIGDRQVQRDDLYKIALSTTNAAASALEKIGRALQSGNKVWFVGQPVFLPQGQQPPLLPPAPYGPQRWFYGPYEQMWAMEAGYLLQNHAVHGQKIMDRAKNVHEDENLPLWVFEGWRSPEAAPPVTK